MKTRTQRQLEAVQNWKTNNCIGTIVATTGFGKTYTSILAINLVKPKDIIVVVPTIVLKDQWTKELTKHKVNNFKVIVINTASRLQDKCDMLIIDEYHTVGAVTFREVLNSIKYNKLLTLTATIERMDGEHEFLLSKSPIVDSISLKEALDNKWVNQFMVYNLPVPFGSEELSAYNKADKAFKYFAMVMGYNAFDTAKKWLASGTTDEKGKAMAYYNAMRKRKQLILENSNKLDMTIDIVKKFNTSKFIVFPESIQFADDLESNLKKICVKIHSKMTKKQQETAMKSFNDPKSKIRGIASVKALSAGLDIPELDLGIRASFNSSKLVNTQSLGRLLRIVEGKQTRFINLYTPDTQEFNWLNKSQEGQSNIKWIKSIDEIK